MNARWWWCGYALAVAVVLTAMGWFTLTVMSGQAAERRAERAAFADETARLALWRMDSYLATVIAREAGQQRAVGDHVDQSRHPASTFMDAAHRQLGEREAMAASDRAALLKKFSLSGPNTHEVRTM